MSQEASYRQRHSRSHEEAKRTVLRWLGPKLRKRMRELEITQQTLSSMTGIGVSTISDYLAGQYEPNLSKIIALRDALKVDWGFFFEEDFRVRGRLPVDGLLSCWTFDRPDVRAGVVQDIWGTSDAKLSGAPQFVPGRYGEAIHFGSERDCIQFDDSRMPDGNMPRTITAWVSVEQVSLRYGFSSVVEWGQDTQRQRCGLLITEHLQVYFVGQFADMPSNGAIDLKRWNHIAATYDGTCLKLYINGQLDREGTPRWGGQPVTLDTQPGMGRMGLNIRDEEPFTGALDEVAVYRRALSKKEIQSIAGKVDSGEGLFT